MCRTFSEKNALDHMPVAWDAARADDHVPTCSLAVIPDRDRAVVVLPEDVGVAVAIEVAGAGNMPAARHRAGTDDHVPRLAVIPDRDRAVVVPPEGVGVAVAIEVAGAGNMPAARHRAGTDDHVPGLAVIPDRERAVIVLPEDADAAGVEIVGQGCRSYGDRRAGGVRNGQ